MFRERRKNKLPVDDPTESSRHFVFAHVPTFAQFFLDPPLGAVDPFPGRLAPDTRCVGSVFRFAEFTRIFRSRHFARVHTLQATCHCRRTAARYEILLIVSFPSSRPH